MQTLKKLQSTLKSKYKLILGEKSLAELRKKVSQSKLKVSGRRATAGRKKTVNIPIKDLL